jgi:hypothetical protein
MVRPFRSRTDAPVIFASKMLMRGPLVEAEQDGPIRIQDLTEVVMAGRCLGLAKERLVPFEAVVNFAYADDRPGVFHRISAVDLTTKR